MKVIDRMAVAAAQNIDGNPIKDNVANREVLD